MINVDSYVHKSFENNNLNAIIEYSHAPETGWL